MNAGAMRAGAAQAHGKNRLHFRQCPITRIRLSSAEEWKRTPVLGGVRSAREVELFGGFEIEAEIVAGQLFALRDVVSRDVRAVPVLRSSIEFYRVRGVAVIHIPSIIGAVDILLSSGIHIRVPQKLFTLGGIQRLEDLWR